MISAKQLFDAVELAEASYALLDRNPAVQPNDDDGLVQALQESGREAKLTQPQARALANSWSLSHHQPDTATGFSATLFQSKADSSDFVLAIRGTEFTREPFLDLGQADIGGIIIDGLSVNQIVDLYNYWQFLKARPGGPVRLARIAVTADASDSGIFQTVVGGSTEDPQLNYRRVEFFTQSGAGLGKLTGYLP